MSRLGCLRRDPRGPLPEVWHGLRSRAFPAGARAARENFREPFAGGETSPAAGVKAGERGQRPAARAVDGGRRSRRWALVGIFSVSLVTRLLMLAVTGPVISSDSYQYLGVAENLVRHGALLEEDVITGELRPHTLRTPGYLIYTALFYFLFGINPTAHAALAVSQVVLASLLGVLVAAMGWRLFSPRVGLVAGLLAALDPWLSYASISLLTDTLYSLCYFLFFLAGAWTLHKPTPRRVVVWAGLLALCTLIRPVAEYQLLIVTGLLLIVRAPRRRRIVLVALVLATMGLLVGAWRVRNRVEAGYWDLATHKGRTLLWETAHLTEPSTPEQWRQDPRLARARDVVAASPRTVAERVAQAPHEEKPHEGQVAFMRLRRELGLSEREADRVMAVIAYENMWRHPLEYSLRTVRESLLFMTRVSLAVDLLWELGIVDTGVLESLEEGRYVYPMANLALRLATAVAFVPLLLLGLISAWRTHPQRRLLHLFFALLLVYHFLIVGVVFGDDRYRLPLHGMVWLYATYGAIGLAGGSLWAHGASASAAPRRAEAGG